MCTFRDSLTDPLRLLTELERFIHAEWMPTLIKRQPSQSIHAAGVMHVHYSRGVGDIDSQLLSNPFAI